MAGGLCPGAFLPPARHAAVDQSRVSGEGVVGPEAEPFGDAGAKAFDEDVGAFDQAEDLLDVGGILEVRFDDGAAAQLVIVWRDLSGALDADDVCAEVGEQ